ncbi:MAG: recombinase RecB, partial [Gemmatimonadota bacterium]
MPPRGSTPGRPRVAEDGQGGEQTLLEGMPERLYPCTPTRL